MIPCSSGNSPTRPVSRSHLASSAARAQCSGLAPVAGAWLIVVALSGYVGLGTMCASAAVPATLLLGPRFHATPRASPALITFGMLAAAFIVWTHRANIARMLTGAEHRSRRLWLLRGPTARL